MEKRIYGNGLNYLDMIEIFIQLDLDALFLLFTGIFPWQNVLSKNSEKWKWSKCDSKRCNSNRFGYKSKYSFDSKVWCQYGSEKGNKSFLCFPQVLKKKYFLEINPTNRDAHAYSYGVINDQTIPIECTFDCSSSMNMLFSTKTPIIKKRVEPGALEFMLHAEAIPSASDFTRATRCLWVPIHE